MDIEDIFKELNEKFDEYHDEARQCLFDGISDILDTNSSGQDPSAHESRRDRLYSDECEFEWDPSPMHKDSESEDESISPNTKKKKAKRKVVFTEKEEAILRREKAKVPMTKVKDIARLLNNKTWQDVQYKWKKMNHEKVKSWSVKSPEGEKAKKEASKRMETAAKAGRSCNRN